MYTGIIIRDLSLDPQYTVKFTYTDDKYDIKNAIGIFLRTSPSPKISFDDYTDHILERFEVDLETITNIKLQIGKTVCDFLLSKRF